MKTALMTLINIRRVRTIVSVMILLLSGVLNTNASHSLTNTQIHSDPDEQGPQFLAQLTNITVPQGRDISFTCVVDNLGQYRVAWIKSDSKAILGIHTHMVSLNPRLSVTHNGHNTWKLHISHVQLNDSGSYMCQVNTDPMKSLSGYLDVVVPPDILNHPDQNIDEGVSTEGGSISLQCSATGVPEPMVQWRREGGKDIMLRTESRDKQALKSVEGERLTLTNVHRTDMGGYLCIASNGVPPSVSKRFDIHVNFPPTIKAVNQLVGAPVEREVTLECIVEVYPKPLNGWYRNEGNVKLHNGNKYNISEALINLYTWHLNLTIRHLTKSDFGAYSCSSVNALGKSETRIRLQELRLPPKSTTTATPHVLHTTSKPRRKQQQQQTSSHNKGTNEVVRTKETHFSNQMQQENDVFNGGGGGGGGIGNVPHSGGGGLGAAGGTGAAGGGIVASGNVNGMINGAEDTQLPARNGFEKTYKSGSGMVATPRTPWTYANAGSQLLATATITTNALMAFFCILSMYSVKLI
ncbi:lachesin isoform X2 [Drosophila sulfurigaster albostrigata]|uniref:lachesin isoform X2 n=1 Tax=Drosophila sulfurigaster albostrigata TaxID=89887 RepID=UPI002D21B4C4|nr:lachesin isoform X2 [Drosophila sulfurigaster albostrigata]